MPRWSRRTVTADPAPAPRVTALEYYGAVLLRDLSGWWVYALGDIGDGHVFYAGQSENLLSRLRDHAYTFKAQFDPAQVWLVPCASQADADRKELELIDFYQPEHNSAGRTEVLRQLARGRTRGARGIRNDSEVLDSRKVGG
jgi:hypothetical protein